ncbi:MAG: hypothetical protein R3296_07625 [Oleiphilaceae bacterium]|nr:hypothetical protein [Oleiphilaceae bacterium]
MRRLLLITLLSLCSYPLLVPHALAQQNQQAQGSQPAPSNPQTQASQQQQRAAALRQRAPQVPKPDAMEGRFYLGVLGSNHQHRSIGRDNDRIDTQGAGLILGRFLTDHFLVELRGGGDFEKDKPDPALDIHVDGYISAYMGLYLPWTHYSALYAQMGVSGVKGDAVGPALEEPRTERDENDREVVVADFTGLEEDYLGTPFSASFLLGVNLKLFGDAYISAEYGRLHRDTQSGVQIWQSNLILRYVF